MRRLLLARHGQSVSNAVRRFQGAQDVALSPLGRAPGGGPGPGRRPPADRRTSTRARSSAPARHRRDRRWRGLGLAADAGGRPARAVAGRLGGLHGRGDPRAARRSLRAAGCAIPCDCLPPGGEPLADVQARVVRRGGADRGRASRRRRRARSSRHGGVISALPRALARACRSPRSGGSRSPTARSPEVAPPRVVLGERDRPPARHRRRRSPRRSSLADMTLLALFGGLALLLYGMQLIGEGLQRAAGGHLRHLLTSMTAQPPRRGASGALGDRAHPVLVGHHAHADRLRLGRAPHLPPVARRHPGRRHRHDRSPCSSSPSRSRSSRSSWSGVGLRDDLLRAAAAS